MSSTEPEYTSSPNSIKLPLSVDKSSPLSVEAGLSLFRDNGLAEVVFMQGAAIFLPVLLSHHSLF